MILVDPRVGSKDLVEPLSKRVNCKVKLARPMLNSGDVCFDGNGPHGSVLIGVEVKELSDFLGSMRSERLAGKQVVGMADDYALSFVIVQGYWKPGANDVLLTLRGREWQVVNLAAKDSGYKKCFHYSEMFKHIISLSVIKNVIVLRSQNRDETVWQIAHLYSWWQREWSDHRSTDPIKLQTEVVFYKVSLLRKMAAELPGIGWTRSKAVEAAFMSVHSMVNASVEAWESIEGIGPTIAKRVWKELREKA